MNFIKHELELQWKIKSTPSKSLRPTLNKLSKEQLRGRINFLGLPFDYRYKRETLIENIIEHLESHTNRYDLFTWSTDEEINFLAEFKAMPHRPFSDDVIEKSEFLLDIGLLHLYEYEDKLILASTKEFIEIIDQAHSEENKQIRALKSQLLDFLKAASTLYGAVTLDTLYQIYNSYFPNQLDADIFQALTYASQVRNENFWIDDEIFLNSAFTDEVYFETLMPEILNSPLPYYHPEPEEFLSYASKPLNQRGATYETLLEFLTKKAHQKKNYLLSDLSFTLEFIPLEGFYKYLNQLGVQFDSNSELKKVTDLFLSEKHQTRNWICHGFTYDEVQKLKPESVRVTKIGRNEKCPCKSNKKYKHCCGAQ